MTAFVLLSLAGFTLATLGAVLWLVAAFLSIFDGRDETGPALAMIGGGALLLAAAWVF